MSATPRTDAEIKRTARTGAVSGMEQAWEDMCYHAKDLETELSAAQAENLRLREDAERYRWMRQVPQDSAKMELLVGGIDPNTAEEFDSAIDTARKVKA